MKITNLNSPVSGRPMSNRHLLFGLLAASIAACPALQATAQEDTAKAPPGNTVIATPKLGGTPGQLLVNAKDTFVYVTVEGNAIAVIDTSSNTVTATWSLGAGIQLLGMAITPNGKDLYVGEETTSGPVPTYGVAVVDTTSGTVTTTVSVNGIPFLPAVSPDGSVVYAPINTGELIGFTTINEPGSVAVISTKTNKVTHTIPVGGTAFSVAFNSSGTQAYVSDPVNASVEVIDTATSKVTHTVLVGGYDLYVTPNKATNDIYALLIAPTSLNGGTGLAVIKGDKLIHSITLPTGDTIGLPGFTPNGRYAYVPVIAVDGSAADFVYLMDTSNNKVVGTNIPVGNAPSIAAVAHNGKFAYVSNQADGTVSVIQITPAQ
jgi:YVTN family beta-propeller protein